MYAIRSYYDLEEVQQHNRDLQLARQEKRSAGVQESEALAGALPKLAFEAGYNANLTDYYMYLDLSALQPGATGVTKAPSYNFV